MSNKQQQIEKAIKAMLAEKAKAYTEVPLEEQVKREAERDRTRYFERKAREDFLREKYTWMCAHCGVVHEPKPSRRPDSTFYLVRVEECDCEAYQAEKARAEAEQTRQAIEHRRFCLTGQDLWQKFDVDWPDSPEGRDELSRAKGRILVWYMSDAGGGLVLSGHYGCGKTHLLRSVMRGYMYQSQPVTFYSEPDLIGAIKEGEARVTEILRHCHRSQVIVLDDVGAGEWNSSNEWIKLALQVVYFRLLEPRCGSGRRTLISTNCKFDELQEKLGGRAMSRVQQIVGNKENWLSLWNVSDYRARGFWE